MFGNSNKMIATEFKDFFQECLGGSNRLLCVGKTKHWVILIVVVIVVVMIEKVIVHFPPMDFVQDENVRIGFRDGTNDSSRDCMHISFVLGRQKGLNVPL